MQRGAGGQRRGDVVGHHSPARGQLLQPRDSEGLYDVEKPEEREAAERASRRSQVGSGDRSEKIRTYNGPQNRVTDHRIGFDRFDVPGVLSGELLPFHEALAAAEQAARLADDGAS